ncbi:hypothetical protein BTO05_13710 [Winogradskyella sp. PC-19]|uniref:hypothetical protein n=1 Tax=unclassified Winogradskyella TaxID=2615021 RepID=UPI000B3C8201|nr:MULTISPECIES: hypothetical protein [unclassified Winogradskyella]ARV10638.1 hypothetical protein BTO05_13710 [Winogradskyella sp. PC-19]
MRFTYTLKKLTAPFIALGGILMLSSCGAYQYVGYDNDGIYSSDEVVVDVNEAATNRTNDNYYANYFAEHVNEAQLLQDEGDVFTDIDSYSSGSVASQDVEIIEDYGGWGQVNDQVTINYYNTGWNNWGWGFNDPWLWNGGFGFGWNNFGWNNWRWNRWYGNIWYSPWAWNGGFGWGYNNWGWNNGYHRNQFAYNYSRRGNAYNRSSVQNSRRNRTGVSRRLASVNRRGTTVGRRNMTTRPSRTIRDPRIRGGNSTSTRPSRGTVTRPSRGTTTRPSRGTTTRPSRGTTTRSSRGSVSRPSRSGSVRSSRSSSSRSSGSVRSSSSRSSSSGGSRSGGSRGGGRRG